MNYRDFRDKRIKKAGIRQVLWILEPGIIALELSDTVAGWVASYGYYGQPEDDFFIIPGSYLVRFILEQVIFSDERDTVEDGETCPDET